MASEGEEAAGEWGSYHCDTPEITIRNLLDYVVNEVQPDILVWTGDNTPHDSQDLTSMMVTNYTIAITKMIKQAVEGTDITVLPIHGNHDTFPVDQMKLDAPGENYPINNFKHEWTDWLTDDAMESFGMYGYYSMPLTIKSDKQIPAGSKIIALNTNLCDALNPFALTAREDPGHMFEWFQQELESIE